MPQTSSSDSEILKAIRDKIAELEDLQLVNKLDIINMKNELDKMNLTSSTDSETAERISELSKMAKKAGDLKNIQKAYSDISDLKSKLEKSPSMDLQPLKADLDSIKKRMTSIEGMKLRTLAPDKRDAAPLSDELKKRLDELEKKISSVKAPRGSAVSDDVTDDLEKLKKRVAGLEATPQKPVAAAREISRLRDELEERLQRLEKKSARAPASGKAALPADFSADFENLKSRISGLESVPRKPGAAGDARAMSRLREEFEERFAELEKKAARTPAAGKSGVPAGLAADMSELKRKVSALSVPATRSKTGDSGAWHAALKKELDGLRSLIDSQNSRISMLSSARAGPARGNKAPPGPTIPVDFMRRMDKLDKAVSQIGFLKSSIEQARDDISEIEKGMKGASGVQPDIEDMISGLEKRIDTLAKSKPSAQEKPQAALRIDGLKSTIESQGKAIAALQKLMLKKEPDKSDTEAGLSDRIESVSNEINAMKARMMAMEQKGAQQGMSPEALRELKNMKGQFPADEFFSLKKRLAEMEKNLLKLGKLAEVLKPIELPSLPVSSERGDSKKTAELESRLKAMEKLVGDGIGPEKLAQIEERMDEMKSTLPTQVGKGTERQLAELKKKMEDKLSEMEKMKGDIVEATIDQLLAQPQSVSKFMDRALKKQLEDMQSQFKAMMQQVKPVDAKMAALLKDSEEKERDIEKLKSSVNDMEKKSEDVLEKLEIEIRALGTKITSMSGTVKGVEGAGVTGIMRDLEILKTKQEWLESTVHKFDLKHIYDKIEELEDRVRSSGGYHPIVIE